VKRFETGEAPGSGRAEDVSRAILTKLRRGEIGPEREIDLHRLDARAAHKRLTAELAAAARNGERCVLVIHGRGLHSESGAVLRNALPGWLASAPLADRVQAYAPAQRSQGGSGATLVLLRRQRAPRVSSAASEDEEQDDPWAASSGACSASPPSARATAAVSAWW
jgi:DNA-nicking Smr family endonuclease